MKRNTDSFYKCVREEIPPQYALGEFFLRRALEFLESKFWKEIQTGRTIKTHRLYKLLGRQLSIKKENIRFLLRMLDRRFPHITLKCNGITIKKSRVEVSEEEIWIGGGGD